MGPCLGRPPPHLPPPPPRGGGCSAHAPRRRPCLAQRLRELQRARTRLTPLALDQLRVLLPAEASRVCDLGRVTMEEGPTADTEAVLSGGKVSAPLVHVDRTLGVLRAEA